MRAVDGRDSVDVSSFMKQTGLTALDQGFVNTASTKSAITYIDGDAGILRYRGYAIEDLARNSTYLETAWLLIYGELPTAAELARFEDKIRHHTLLHEDLKTFFSALPHTAHPMSVLSSAVSALSTYYEDSLDPHNPEMVEMNTIRLLAKLPVIAAYAHKKSLGQAFLYPDNSLSFVENFLKLNFGNMAEPYEINPVLVNALERLLILHEDHEQNASTSTVRLVGSTEANIFASISAGINALYGPLHGGANEAVLKMLRQIQESGESVQKFVERVKNKEDGVKLMGFGHRVYKNFDPRAKLVKESADEVLADLGVKDPLLDIAKEARRGGARRRLLHRAQALPQRRLLHRRDLQGDGLPGPHLHRAVRDRSAARAGSRTGVRQRPTRRRRSVARSSCTSARLPGSGPAGR